MLPTIDEALKELKIAEEQRDDLGKIAYHFGNKPKNGIAHLVCGILLRGSAH